MTSTFNPTTAQAVWFHITLRKGTSRSQSRRWYRRLRRHLRGLGLVVGERLGLCFVLAIDRPITNDDRHAVLNWMVDQPHTAVINLGDLVSMDRALTGTLPAALSGSDKPPTAQERSYLAVLMCKAAESAVIQWLVARDLFRVAGQEE